MIVHIEESKGTSTVSIMGRIDASTVQQLQADLDTISMDHKLILDFKDVMYISSAGLRIMLILRKRFKDDRLEIVNVSPTVYEIFEATGFDSVLPIKLNDAEGVGSYLGMSLKDFLRIKTEKFPDHPILTFGTETYTWKDIDQLSQIVAEDLFKMGVKKRSHVGIMGVNSANWVITFFAVQKIGAIATLLNPNLTPAEIQEISEIGDITHLCYGEIPYVKDENEFLRLVTDEASSKIRYTYSISNDKHLRDRIGEYVSEGKHFAEMIIPDDPAIIIFTSGSTSKPKAVLLSAFNVLNAALVFKKNYRINENDSVCLVLPMFHVLGLTCAVFGNILTNSRLIIPSDTRTKTIIETICEYKCTQLYSVPTLLLAIVANKEFKDEYADSIRRIFMGGAPLMASQLAEIEKHFNNAYISAGYGLSEIAPVTLTAFDDTHEHIIDTVGKPMEHVSLRIEDPVTGEELPQGSEGELLVMGFNSMVGYYHLPLDKQPIDENGWLHTGDLAKIDEEGYVHLTGRIKDLIIRGGENIVPGEIEKVLTQYPDVYDAKVMGVPDNFYGEVVGAAVVAKEGRTIDTDALKEFVAARLAKFKIPAYLVVYDSFPSLSNGKTDAVSLKKDFLAKVKGV